MLHDLGDDGLPTGVSSTQDLVGFCVPFPEGVVHVCGGYCRQGDYAAQPARIASDTKNVRTPFLWASDFNQDP